MGHRNAVTVSAKFYERDETLCLSSVIVLSIQTHSVFTSFTLSVYQIDAKRDQLSDAKRELKSAKADAKVRKDEKSKK